MLIKKLNDNEIKGVVGGAVAVEYQLLIAQLLETAPTINALRPLFNAASEHGQDGLIKSMEVRI